MASEPVLVSAVGFYTGEGIWHDDAGVSHRYDIEMRIDKMAEGHFRQWFKHIFVEETTPPTDQTVDYIFQQNGVFNLPLIGTALQGLTRNRRGCGRR